MKVGKEAISNEESKPIRNKHQSNRNVACSRVYIICGDFVAYIQSF